MSATPEPTIAELAELSRLALDEQELATAAQEIHHLRAYIARIQEIGPEAAQPMGDPDGETAPPRPDLPGAALTTAQALASAPNQRSRSFALPKVIDGSGR